MPVERAFQSVCSKHFPRDVTRSCEHLNLGFRNIKMIQRPLRCHFMNVKVRRKRILKGVRPQCDGSNTQVTQHESRPSSSIRIVVFDRSSQNLLFGKSFGTMNHDECEFYVGRHNKPSGTSFRTHFSAFLSSNRKRTPLKSACDKTFRTVCSAFQHLCLGNMKLELTLFVRSTTIESKIRVSSLVHLSRSMLPKLCHQGQTKILEGWTNEIFW